MAIIKKVKKNLITKDIWLSNTINQLVYKINIINNNLNYNDLLSFIDKTKKENNNKKILFYCKFDIKNKTVKKNLLLYGFKFIVKELIFEKKKNGKILKKLDTDLKIRKFLSKDIKQLTNIAKDSFSFSRFYLDKKISNTKASFIKQKWIENFFLGLRGDNLIIAEKKDKVVGFLLLIKKNQNLIIDLIAVHENYRRYGYASKMINYLENKYKFKKLVVGTQSINTKSIKLYKKFNFKLIKSHFVYHLHK